ILDNTDDTPVPVLIAAYITGVYIRDMSADCTELKVPFHLHEASREIDDIVFLHIKNIKCQALGCLRPDTRQFHEAVNQLGYWFWIMHITSYLGCSCL